eukprot:2364090-Rhodomonas_salina.1
MLPLFRTWVECRTTTRHVRVECRTTIRSRQFRTWVECRTTIRSRQFRTWVECHTRQHELRQYRRASQRTVAHSGSRMTQTANGSHSTAQPSGLPQRAGERKEGCLLYTSPSPRDRG